MFITGRHFRLNRFSSRVIAATAAALFSVFAGSAAAAQPATNPVIGRTFGGPGLGWLPGRGALAPQPGSAADLRGVFCTSAASCWAVGYFERNGAWLNETLRWNGHHWSRVAAPNPGGIAGGDTSQLFGVRCTAVKNCWAVGFYLRHEAELDEAIHWNGKSWSLMATPTPAGTQTGHFNELGDVACISSDSCWAAGEYGPDKANGVESENQALHWNGKKWSMVTTPDPGDNATDGVSALSAIRCASAGNCWAVGTYGSNAPGGVLLNEALHWNGRKWSLAAVPDNAQSSSDAFNMLQGLACTSAANCWATGSDGFRGSSPVTINQAMHWNGHEWSSVPIPQPDGVDAFTSNVLTGVSCSSPANCWAVGYLGNLDHVAPVLSQALHWNGSAWSVASVPSPGGSADGDSSFLYGIRCTSRTSCWAVGQAQPSGQAGRNALLHWNGTKWSASLGE